MLDCVASRPIRPTPETGDLAAADASRRSVLRPPPNPARTRPRAPTRNPPCPRPPTSSRTASSASATPPARSTPSSSASSASCARAARRSRSASRRPQGHREAVRVAAQGLEKRLETQRKQIEKRTQKLRSELEKNPAVKRARDAPQGRDQAVRAGRHRRPEPLQIASTSDLERIDRKISAHQQAGEGDGRRKRSNGAATYRRSVPSRPRRSTRRARRHSPPPGPRLSEPRVAELAAMASFHGLDFLRLDELLSDEERLARDTRARVGDARVPAADPGARAPRRLVPDGARARRSPSSACSAPTSRATAARA